jgi:hypothetical protein
VSTLFSVTVPRRLLPVLVSVVAALAILMLSTSYFFLLLLTLFFASRFTRRACSLNHIHPPTHTHTHTYTHTCLHAQVEARSKAALKGLSVFVDTVLTLHSACAQLRLAQTGACLCSV